MDFGRIKNKRLFKSSMKMNLNFFIYFVLDFFALKLCGHENK